MGLYKHQHFVLFRLVVHDFWKKGIAFGNRRWLRVHHTNPSTLVGWLVQTIMRQPFLKAMDNQLKNTVYNIILVTIVDMVEVSIARLMCLILVEVILYLALKSDT